MALNSKKGTKPEQGILSQKVMSIFNAHPNKQMNYKQIAKNLELTKQVDRQKIAIILHELSEKGTLFEINPGKYRLNHTASEVIGIVHRDAKGAMWLTPENPGEQILIPERSTNRAIPGDTVKAFLFPKRKGKPMEGEVTEVLKRGKTEFVGILDVTEYFAFLVPESKKIGFDIFIPNSQLKGGKKGQKAIARIVEWPEKAKNPIGQIIEILGNPGENETEMHAILAEFGLPYHYPKAVEEAAEHIEPGITPEEIAKRRDFRNTFTFTIDPYDAKDFDDAISYKVLDNNRVEIGVHIADVTHYVTPGSIIEEEAEKRATSVYLVDRVVPMLPERLSNFICSLRPDEEKLTFSAVFVLDEKANVLEQWFGRTVIKSTRRFTYEEAQTVLETGEGDYAKELLHINQLAKTLKGERFRNGSIDFERNEVKFIVDETGKPVKVFFKEPKDSNHLIEEFMLLANRKVAEYVGKKSRPGAKAPTFVYRIHDKPDPEKFANFKSFIKKFGYRLSERENDSLSKSINALLQEVKGKGEQGLIETLTIRSMAKAVYTTHNIGHYGLGFKFYTHFTSPIRRYPDMMVHRLLQHYLDNGKSVNQDEYEEACEHSSGREILAAQAERASIKYKQVEFMSDKRGQKFAGTISGVTEWGIYVEITENTCEGMVSVRDLKDDFYAFDENNYCLIGRKYGRMYRLGDKVTIEVVGTNLAKRQLDFLLVEK